LPAPRSFNQHGGELADEADADVLAALNRAVPTASGHTGRLTSLGPLLNDIEARIVDEDANTLPVRGMGVIALVVLLRSAWTQVDRESLLRSSSNRIESS
jgi:hypothetical protein